MTIRYGIRQMWVQALLPGSLPANKNKAAERYSAAVCHCILNSHFPEPISSFVPSGRVTVAVVFTGSSQV